MLRFTLLVAAFGTTLSLSLPAAGQAPSTGADHEARALFDAGNLAFSEGRYENAVEHFQRAYELSRRPELLYNIGVAAERLRRDAVALQAFRDYLAQVPDTAQRAAVESRIAILEAAVAARESGDEEPATPGTELEAGPSEVDLASPGSGADTTGPVVLTASGSVVALVGGILLGMAVGDTSSVENAERGTRWDTVSDAYSRAEPLSIAGGVMLGTGAAVAIGGLVWLAVPTEQRPVTATVQVVPGFGSLVVRGSF